MMDAIVLFSEVAAVFLCVIFGLATVEFMKAKRIQCDIFKAARKKGIPKREIYRRINVAIDRLKTK